MTEFFFTANVQEEKDKEVELQHEKTTSEETDSEGTGSDTDSDSEQISSDRSPVSGSVHYFIAPLDSSRSQAMVIEELNQVGRVLNSLD